MYMFKTLFGFSGPKNQRVQNQHPIYAEAPIWRICQKLVEDQSFIHDEGWTRLAGELGIYDLPHPTPFQNNRPFDICYSLLRTYVSRFSHKATVQSLKDALARTGRNYIADSLQEYAPECILHFDGCLPGLTMNSTPNDIQPTFTPPTPCNNITAGETFRNSNCELGLGLAQGGCWTQPTAVVNSPRTPQALSPSVNFNCANENLSRNGTPATWNSFEGSATVVEPQAVVIADQYSYRSTPAGRRCEEASPLKNTKANRVAIPGYPVAHVGPSTKGGDESPSFCRTQPEIGMAVDVNDELDGGFQALDVTKDDTPMVEEKLGDDEIVLICQANPFMPDMLLAKNIVSTYSGGHLAASETFRSKVGRKILGRKQMKVKIRTADTSTKNTRKKKALLLQEKKKMAQQMAKCATFKQLEYDFRL